MKRWIMRIVVVLLAVTAFPVVFLGVLAAQGRLSSPEVEVLRQMPVFGLLLPPAVEDEGARRPASAKTRAGGTTTRPVRPDRPPAVVTPSSPEQLVAQLRARREFYDEKLDSLDREQQSLARRRADLDDREATLRELQRRLESERGELVRERENLAREGQMITAREAKTLKDTSKAIAEMDTEMAAEALADLDEERAARILRVMDASSVGSIFSEMKDPEQRRRLLDRYTRLHVEEQPKAGGR